MKTHALLFALIAVFSPACFAQSPSPHQSILLISETTNKLCTAAYLGRGDIFVTAAHCTSVKPNYAYLGSDPSHPDPSQIVKIKAVYQNPAYVYGKWSEDVGFVVLDRKISGMSNARLLSEKEELPLKSPLRLYGYHGGLRTEKSLLSAGEDSGNLIAACSECGEGDSGAPVYYQGQLAGVFSAMTDDTIRSLIAPIKAEQIAWLKAQLRASEN